MWRWLMLRYWLMCWTYDQSFTKEKCSFDNEILPRSFRRWGFFRLLGNWFCCTTDCTDRMHHTAVPHYVLPPPSTSWSSDLSLNDPDYLWDVSHGAKGRVDVKCTYDTENRDRSRRMYLHKQLGCHSMWVSVKVSIDTIPQMKSFRGITLFVQG